MELLFEIEHGADRASPFKNERKPLYQKNPLRFWQTVSALLAILVLMLTTVLIKNSQSKRAESAKTMRSK